MAIVTIPYDIDFSNSPFGVVPICIDDRDREGRLIDSRWFSAVIPVADPLRGLAAKALDDVWRVSELTEASVHALWHKHLHNLGEQPSRRILSHAKWTARDLKVGGRAPRRGVEVEMLDSVLKQILATQDVQREVLALEVREMLARHFQARGVPHIDEMLEMWLIGHSWLEIGNKVGKHWETAKRDLKRWLKKALYELDLE